MWLTLVRNTRFRSVVLGVGVALIMGGCFGFLQKTPQMTSSCAFDQAWPLTLASLDRFGFREVNQEKGTIATDWILLSSRKSSGFFGRDMNKVRMRFLVAITPQQSKGIQIRVSQIREFFSPMGVQSQSGWRRIAPVEEEIQDVVQVIANKLRSKGCRIAM